MLAIILRHLNAAITELKSVELPDPAHKVLFSDTLRLLTEIHAALEYYFVYADSDRLNRDLITSGMDFTERWGLRIAAVEAPTPSHVLNETLLRHVKGCLKAWRIWRVTSQS